MVDPELDHEAYGVGDDGEDVEGLAISRCHDLLNISDSSRTIAGEQEPLPRRLLLSLNFDQDHGG